MILVKWPGSDLVNDILNDLAYIKTLFSISSSTIPFISNYTVYIDEGVLTDEDIEQGIEKITEISIKNSKGQINSFITNNGIIEIDNFLNGIENSIFTLGENIIYANITVQKNSNIIKTYNLSRKFEAKYILSLLTWISFANEETYKMLLPTIDYTTLSIAPEDVVIKKYKGILNFPYFLSKNIIKQFISAFLSSSLYNTTEFALKNFIEKIKLIFTCNYELIDLKKTPLFKLPGKKNDKFLRRVIDVKIDEYYEPIQGNPNIYYDTKQDRIHYILKKQGYNLSTNEKFAMLVTIYTKLVGFIIKFIGLKYFVRLNIYCPKLENNSQTFTFSTNLDYIIKNIEYYNVLYPRLIYNDVELIYNIDYKIEKDKLIFIGPKDEGIYIFECLVFPKNLIFECIQYLKSLNSIIKILYFDYFNKPYEIY